MRSIVRAAVVVFAVVIGGPFTSAQSVERSADAQFAQRYKSAEAAMRRVRDAFAKRDYARAGDGARAILAKMPEFSEASFVMAKISYMEKSYANALEFIEKAKATFASTAVLMLKMEQDRLSTMKQRRDEQNGVISALTSELARAPQDQQLQIRQKIERAERIRDDIDRVLNESLLRVDDRSAPPEYFFIHGNILLRMNRYPEAAEQYAEALRLNPAYADAANNLAALQYSEHQYDKALEVLEQVEAKGGIVNPELKQDVLKALGRSHGG